MKTILVTSDLTYAPQNYYDVLEFVVNNSREHIAGVVFIKIDLLNIFGRALHLYFSGCKNIANTLARNISATLLEKKKMLLKKHNIPFICAKNVNNLEVISWIQQIRPDLILNMRTRCIYKDAVLIISRLGCVNVHHGILPEQKGLFCDLYALENHRKTGFTIHEMTRLIDEGQILYREKIRENKNYMKYLINVSSKEKVAIANFINKTAQNHFLPKGIQNKYEEPTVTTTPDFQTIKRLQRNGIIL